MDATIALLDCGHEPSEHSDFTTGYGTDRSGKKHCYACCAENDKADMRATGKATLYDCDSELTNWPGSLRIRVMSRRRSNHNIARYRYDVWFRFEGQQWHGVRYGDNTQIVHCRRTK